MSGEACCAEGGDSKNGGCAMGVEDESGAEMSIPEDCLNYPELMSQIKIIFASKVCRKKGDVTWQDIIGSDEVKNIITTKFIIPRKYPQSTLSNNILVFGQPGCGKTNIGKISTELDACFLPVQASDILSRWMGQGEKGIRAIFTVARAWCFSMKWNLFLVSELIQTLQMEESFRSFLLKWMELARQ
jgi:hypothetical protein